MILDFNDIETIQEWIERQDNYDGKDLPNQYNYMLDRHPVEWRSNVEMETNRYTKERN